jgi:hemolysin activation/secretion protein
MDFKSFNEDISFTNAPVTSDIVEYAPLNFALNLGREGTKDSTKVSLSLTAGLRGIGSNTAVFENKRFDARPNFIHINFDATQTETIWHGVIATARVSAQVADGPLVSSEEFSAGGMSSVRGYLQSEAVGDQGVTGTLQLTSPAYAPKFIKQIDDLRAYLFVDGGELWILHPLPEQQSEFSLLSAGIGLSIDVMRHLKAEGEVAVPFIAGAATHVDRPRATFRLKSDF